MPTRSAMRKTWPSDAPELSELLFYLTLPNPRSSTTSDACDPGPGNNSANKCSPNNSEDAKQTKQKRDQHTSKGPAMTAVKSQDPRHRQEQEHQMPKNPRETGTNARRLAATVPQRVMSPARCVQLRTHRLRVHRRKPQTGTNGKRTPTPHQPRPTKNKSLQQHRARETKQGSPEVLFGLLGLFGPF